jgi:ribonuclease T1
MPRSVKALWLLLGLLLCLPLAVQAGHGVRNTAELPYISQADLPAEARDSLRLIKQGGPFPFPRDGAVFGNYEHRLPQQARGCTSDTLLTKSAACGRRCEADAPAPKGSAPPCRVRYHEYTVLTPGARNRGARRIVCGVFPECYFTADHYRTFQRIRE